MTTLNFRQGLVRYQNSGSPNFTPTFLQPSSGGAYVDIVVSSDPTIITFAHNSEDYLYSENVSVSQAWGPFVSGSYWLYWDVDLTTGIFSRGFSNFAPTFGSSPPSSPGIGQYWFNTTTPVSGLASTVIGQFWNGASWTPCLRVFANLTAFTGGNSITPSPIGSQVGITNVIVNAGVPLFDDINRPIQRIQRDGQGVFIHTAMSLAAQWSRLANFEVDATLSQAKAAENISQYSVVALVGPSQIGLARNTLPQFPAIGLASEDMTTGEIRTYMVSGLVTNSNWSWDINNTQPVSTPLFVDVTGEITTIPPQVGSIQQIGTIVDAQIIYVDVQPIITYG